MATYSNFLKYPGLNIPTVPGNTKSVNVTKKSAKTKLTHIKRQRGF